VLPRLYRDAIVYESWEGTHNVLTAQVLADLSRLPVLDVVEARLGALLDASSAESAKRARAELDDAVVAGRRAEADADFGARYFRRVLDRLLAVARVAYLLEADDDLAAEHLLHTTALATRVEDDPGHPARVDALAAATPRERPRRPKRHSAPSDGTRR
jgi:hypothetical protein